MGSSEIIAVNEVNFISKNVIERHREELANDDDGNDDALRANPKVETRRVTIDEILERWVGELGKAQILHFLLTSLAWTVESIQTMVMIFADRTPFTTHCHPTTNHTYHDGQHNLVGNTTTTTTTNNSNAIFNNGTLHYLCQLKNEPYLCSSSSQNRSNLINTMWDHSLAPVTQSTVSQWGLFCEDSYKVGLVQSAFFVGSLIGAGLFGNLSDSSFMGRKRVLMVTCAMNAALGMATAATPEYWVYVLLRMLTGISCGGLGLTSFVLATELVGPSKRALVGMIGFNFYSLGIIILSGLAYFFPLNWRYLYIVTSAPAILYSFALPFLHESPRWYLVHGRHNDALNVLRHVARKNGNEVPKGVGLLTECADEVEAHIGGSSYAELIPIKNNHGHDADGAIGNLSDNPMDSSTSNSNNNTNKKNNNSPRESGTIVDVFKIPTTRVRMAVMIFIWFACAMAYYGISLNVSNLNSNLYLSVILNALAELPAYAITALFVGRFGRRFILVTALFISALSCIVGSLLSSKQAVHHHASIVKDLPLNISANINWVNKIRVVCSALGIFGTSATYNILYIYTSELFPTVVRSAALGMASQSGQVGAIISPMVVLLARMIHPSIPFAIFGIASLLGAILAFFKLPETFHLSLFETFNGLIMSQNTKNPNDKP